MLFGPWLTGRSPMPMALSASTSQWIGFESWSSAAAVFIFSGSMLSMTSGGSSVPTSTSATTSGPPREDERVRRDGGGLAVLVLHLQAEGDDVEHAGLAALLAGDAGDAAADLVGVADAE